MEEVRSMSTSELLKMLGINKKDGNSLSMQKIIDNVSPTIRPKVKAVIELYKRSLDKKEEVEITSVNDTLKVVVPMLKDLEHEECWALLLDSEGNMIRKQKVCSGILARNQINVNTVCRAVLKEDAASVIIARSHTDGNVMPDENELNETYRLKNALKLIGCSLIDHVIVAKGGDAYSFAEEETFKYTKR